VLGENVPQFSLIPNIKADFGAENKMALVQTLKDLGEQMGLKGTELKEFIKEQQGLEREERNRLREEQERQRESEKEQREHDRIHQHKLLSSD